jgi:outer membrane receptor protein involved in Fe transport
LLRQADASDLLAAQMESHSDTQDYGDASVQPALGPNWQFDDASFLQPLPPAPAERSLQPAVPSLQLSPRGFGSAGGMSRSMLSPERSERARGPSNDILLGSESTLRVTTDTGNLLGKSPWGLGIGIQRRNPIVTDSRIRGQTVGQQVASGSYWFPARQDLDTMLSKIDSRIVQDVIVVKGPYSAIYGPGFSFYDVELVGTPRYQDGREVHSSTSLDYQTNGQQVYGRQNIWGGSDNWGLRVGYGHRTGNDYESGNGMEIPASYNSRDLDVALGMDLSSDSHLEFSYLRLDQTDVEFPAQAFDMDFLVTDGYELTYVLENQAYFDRLVLDTWYNRTRFAGNSQHPSKRRQIPQLDNPLDFYGFTDVDAMSTGFRLATSWGMPDDAQLTAGVDLRRLSQQLNEFNFSPLLSTEWDPDNPNSEKPEFFNFPIPRSHSTNPGLFAEGTLPLTECFALKTGGRMDLVSTDAVRVVANTDLDGNGELDDLEEQLLGGFSQNFALWSAFVTAEYKLDPQWTAVGGFGCAMSPPTLTELYAGLPFLAILQQGFTKVQGNPNLAAERLWQIDLGLNADYGRWQGGIRGFHAWIGDYITFETWGNFPGLSDPALVVSFVNTDFATLVGGEAYGEYDCSAWLTSFGTLCYVEGRDQTRGLRGVFDNPPFFTYAPQEPLPGIAPLESRLGLRVHDPDEQCRWAVELSARIVDNQDRVASSLFEQETPGFTTYDARGYWQATDHLLLIAGVENLTDKQCREHLDLRTGYGVYQPGRSFYFGSELQY